MCAGCLQVGTRGRRPEIAESVPAIWQWMMRQCWEPEELRPSAQIVLERVEWLSRQLLNSGGENLDIADVQPPSQSAPREMETEGKQEEGVPPEVSDSR